MASLPQLLLLSARGAEFAHHIDLVPLGLDELRQLEAIAKGEPFVAGSAAPEFEVVARQLHEQVTTHGPRSLEPETPPDDLALEDAPRVVPPDATSGHLLVAYLPRTAAVTPEGFILFDHHGQPACTLDAVELSAFLDFRVPTTVGVALEAHGAAAGGHALGYSQFHSLVDRLLAAAMIEPIEAADVTALPGGRHATVREQGFAARKTLLAHGNELIREPAADNRVSVIPMYEEPIPLNLALGMLFAYASAVEDGRLLEDYEFIPAWMSSPKALARRVKRAPAVFCFSNYIWSVNQNLVNANMLKALSPDSIMIHGGPSTPKYEHDNRRFFADNPGVDIAVRGEGEETFVEILQALDGRLAGRDGDLSCLADVAGLSYRTPDGGYQRTPDRPRLAELDVLPSPYLLDYYEPVARAGIDFQPVETNRGCPYGCTFCDWGSATNSRIRKFDLDRVCNEIEWGAKNRAETLFIVDANFGIFSRDVEITEKIVECYETYGYPRSLSNCFAKNTTKYTSQICTLLWNAGVSFQPVIALQSMDEGVLGAIDRSNIKTQAYDALADHLRDLGATVFTELMMGLPGSSLRTFSDDLQGCIDREIYATVYDTMVLPNSPMNDPAYVERHQIETEDVPVRPGVSRKIVACTETFTRADRETMQRRRHLFRVFEDVGLLRQVARWVRHTTGTREIDFYDELGDFANAHPERMPLMHWVMSDMQFIVAPLSWRQFFAEVRDYLITQLGIAPSSGMQTALQVQYLLVPDSRRAFPVKVELAHDYAAWYMQIRAAHRARQQWWDVVSPLESFGPATFEVAGSEETNGSLYGTDLLTDFAKFYELESPIMRGARTIEHKLDASPLTYSAS